MNATNLRNSLLRAAAATAVIYGSAPAATLYWDTNDSTTGSGNTGGIWSLVDDNWSSDANGEATATTFSNGDEAVFSAGTDGTGGWTVTVSGTVATNSVTFKEGGNKTVTGGNIDITGGGLIDSSVLGLSVVDLTVDSTITGTGGLTIAAHGDADSNNGGGNGAEFRLYGSNTFSGGLTITSGVVGWNSDSALGDISNSILLDGGGLLWNQGSSTSLTRDIAVGASGGTLRLYGGANEVDFSGTLTGSTFLRRTDGGNVILSGDGSAFTGTVINGGGTMRVTSPDWASTTFDNIGGLLTFANGGTLSIGGLSVDNGIRIDNGTLLDVTSGTLTQTGGGGFISTDNGALGSLTSSSGTLTINNPIGGQDDYSVQFVDFDGSTPLTLNFDNGAGGSGIGQSRIFGTNLHTGGTVINGGRVGVDDPTGLGTGLITVNPGGQFWPLQAATYTNDISIAGNGWTEGAGELGAIRFTNSILSGDVTVDPAGARVVGYSGAGGELSGSLLGSGDLQINIPGNGTANGSIVLSGDGSGYTGNVIVEGGTFTAGALGGGLTSRAGTTNLSGNVPGTFTLDGGTVNLENGATVTSPVISFNSTLNIDAGATVDGDVITDFNNPVDISLSGNITGTLSIDDDNTLLIDGGSVGDLSLGFDGSSTIDLTFLDTLTVNNDVTVSGTQEVLFSSLPAPSAPVTVLTYGGTATDPVDADGIANNFAVAAGSQTFRSVSFIDTGSAITADLGAETGSWIGGDVTNPSFWDTTTANWGTTDNLFFDGDATLFDDTATSFLVEMQSNVSPFSVTVDNTTNDYTLTGSGVGILGSTGITKQGTGNLTLGGANTYTGPVDIQAGSITAGSVDALGATSGVTIASGAQLDLAGNALGNASRAYDYTIEGDGGGNGAITNSGGGLFSNAGIRNITLAGNASVGSTNGRMDIGLANGAPNPNGVITGNGFTLTKVGSGQVPMRGDASGSPINIVIAQGTTWAENTGNAFGGATGTLTVQNGAFAGTYGNLTIATPVTLEGESTLYNQGGGTGTWTGPITLTGDAQIGISNNSMVLEGAISGSGIITKGAGNLTLANADNSGFTGKWFLDANTIIVEDDLSFGAVPGSPTADAITMDNIRIRNNSATLNLAANRGITVTDLAYFDPTAGGSMTVNGDINGTGAAGVGDIIKDNNAGNLTFNGSINTDGRMLAQGGTLTLNGDFDFTESIRVQNDSVVTINSNNGSLAQGFDLGRGTLNVNLGNGAGGTLLIEDWEMGQNGNQPHTSNLTAGDVLGTADVRIGHWGGSTSSLNISGGSLSLPDTVTNPTNEGQANVFLGIDGQGSLSISGGTLNTTSLVLDGRGSTGSPGSHVLSLTGGTLNVGQWGIRNSGANYVIEFGGGVVGTTSSSLASGYDWSSDWSTNLPITLTGINGDTSFEAGAHTISLNGALTGAGGFSLESGTLALNGANSYAGSTLINGGSIVGTGNIGDATIGATAAIGAGANGSAGSTGTFSTGTLQIDGDVTLDLDAEGIGPDDLIAVTGDLNFGAGSTISPRFFGAGTPGLTDTYLLMTYTGTLTGAPTINNQFFADFRAPVTSLDLGVTTPGEVTLDVTFQNEDLFWSGSPTNFDWDVNTSQNWDLAGTADETFFQGDNVEFDELGSNASPINLIGTLTPGSLTVSGDQDYTFSGSGQVGGTTGLLKEDLGTLTLLTDNSYTGPVTITGGSVVVGNGGTSGLLGGTGGVTVSNGAVLTFNRSDAQSPGRAFTGGGELVLDGGGALTTVANNDVDFTINSGTLFARGGNWSTSVAGGDTITVNNGGTLDTTTHSLGGLGGATRPAVINLNEGGTWFLNAEQYLPTSATNMAGGSTAGPGEVRGGATINHTGDVTSTLGARINHVGNITYNVADGAAATDLLVSGDMIGSAKPRKFGPGRMELTGANNTYSGGTDLEEGILAASSVADAGGAGSIGTGYLGVNEGSTFEYTGTGAETTTRQFWIDRGAGGTIDVVDAGATLTFNPGGGTRNAPLTKAGPGTMVLNGLVSGGATVTVSEGTMLLGVANTYTGETTVSNGAILSLGTSGEIESSSEIAVESGGTLNVAGLLSPFNVGSGQTLTGSGSVTGNIGGATGGTVAPGDTIGTLTVTGNATLGGGTLAVDVDDTQTPKSDTLTVTGVLDLTGTTLSVNLTGVAAEAAYVIADYGSLVGTFSSVPAGWTVDYNFGGGDQIAIVPAPTSPYDTYEADNNIVGAGPDADSDGDSIPNGIEFVIGGVSDPGVGQNDLNLLPTIELVNADPDGDTNFEDYLLFSYRRTDAAASTTIAGEYSFTLDNDWTEAQGGVDGVVTEDTDDGYAPGVDRVDVYIPQSLAPDGKIFGRLNVDLP